jgi:hypothetical protein
MMMMILIQFILRANLAAQRPITKRARVENKKHTHTNKIQKQENFYYYSINTKVKS